VVGVIGEIGAQRPWSRFRVEVRAFHHYHQQ
jgi:hypothetical protein